MKHWKKTALYGLMILMAATAAAQGNLTDPFEILNRHVAANGGLDRLKAERRQYLEADIALAGLQGTLKIWTEKPNRTRNEIDLGILKMTQGDNGEYGWQLDSNGKLQKTTKFDEATLKRRELTERMGEFEYLDKNSEIFEVTFGGVEKVDDKDCYVIVIKNKINTDVHTSYINTKTFLLEKSSAIQGENSSDSYYADYRDVNGIMVAYWTKQVMHETGQDQEITITQYVSNPEIDPSLFEPEEAGGKDYRFTNGASAENIPFRFIGNHIYIPVVVNCKERLWVLDSGASMSVIDKAYADFLGVDLQGDLKGKGAGGTVNVSLATLPPFSLEGIEFDEQAIAVIDMSDLIRLLGVDIAGILGFDFLSRFVTKVDYANELVSFYDPETFEYSGDGHETEIFLKNSVFMVQAAIEDKYSGTFLFDLGAGAPSLNGAYALNNGFTDRKGVVSLSHGAGNAFQTKSVICKSFDFGGYKLDNQFLNFSYGGTDTTATFDDIGGLGNTLFRNFVLYVDYADERIILEKGKNFNGVFPEDGSGLKLTRTEDDKIAVMFVSPDTPAEKSGFQEGDILLSLNGIDVKYYEGIIAIRKIFTSPPGTQYTIVVDRNGEEKTMKLKLADLY